MIRVFNDLTNTLVPFEPLSPSQVLMYVCGPTVYDSPHLGHARSEVAFDMIRRYLEFRGFQVKYVHNYTDVDDKMINKANAEGVGIDIIADRYMAEYESMQKALLVKEPTYKPRATAEIPSIIATIKTLETKGYTYQSEGSIWFDTSKLANYKGLFMKSKTKEDGEEIQFTQSDFANQKRNVEDFVLWKAEKPGEPAWDSPWGRGRPGWHIECSAMSMRYLGESIDIHGGGKDLKRPHHQNEIAQSEAATGKPFVKYWLHNGFLNIDNTKMSKSLGNFIVLADLLQKFSGVVLRFFFLNFYYQRPVDFTIEKVEGAQSSLRRIQQFYLKWQDNTKNVENQDADMIAHKKVLEDRITQFYQAMDEDFNTAKAIGHLFGLINYTQKTFLNKNVPISSEIHRLVVDFLDQIDTFLSFIKAFDPNIAENKDVGLVLGENIQESQILGTLIDNLLLYRLELKKTKNYQMADKLRDLLKESGIIVSDTKDGYI